MGIDAGEDDIIKDVYFEAALMRDFFAKDELDKASEIRDEKQICQEIR